MGLQAILTLGWPAQSDTAFVCAETIVASSLTDIKHYRAALESVFSTPSKSGAVTFCRCEQLFRRRRGGFKKIQAFLGAVNEIAQEQPGEIFCELDAFGYAFLKGAKNFDFFLPEHPDVSQEDMRLFRNRRSWLLEQTELLRTYERRGATRGLSSQVQQDYRSLRLILTRASARDERRTLATLLVSGPSSGGEIGKDLGLPYTLGPRILPTFEHINVLQRCNGKYAVRLDALPRTIFLLRETLGFDLLEGLDG